MPLKEELIKIIRDEKELYKLVLVNVKNKFLDEKIDKIDAGITRN